MNQFTQISFWGRVWWAAEKYTRVLGSDHESVGGHRENIFGLFLVKRLSVSAKDRTDREIALNTLCVLPSFDRVLDPAEALPHTSTDLPLVLPRTGNLQYTSKTTKRQR